MKLNPRNLLFIMQFTIHRKRIPQRPIATYIPSSIYKLFTYVSNYCISQITRVITKYDNKKTNISTYIALAYLYIYEDNLKRLNILERNDI